MILIDKVKGATLAEVIRDINRVLRKLQDDLNRQLMDK